VKRSVTILILVLILAGCATTPAPTPVAVAPTQAPTWTPQATYTPNPTYTPYPTLTPGPTRPAATATATLAATATAAPTATPTPVTYIVRIGDMLNLIAETYKVSPESIIAASNITNPNIIEVGRTLVIPVAGTVTTTNTITPTAVAVIRPVVVRPAQPPSNMVYPAPKILYPENGATYKYDAANKTGTDSVTFTWLPVSDQLQRGTAPCNFAGQPNGTTAFLWDRYQIELDPPLYNAKLNQWFNVFHNDQGTNREFNLLEFKPNVSYAWRVAVGRWCVTNNYDNQASNHQGFLMLISPYTEPRTFAWKY
jgi:hypothetical protein